MNKIDLTGKRFGKLTVISETEKRGKHVIWICKCNCGKSTRVSTSDLSTGHTSSCGCFRSKSSSTRATANKKLVKHRENTFVENTNLAAIKSMKFKNNASGTKGVCWDKKNNKWKAYINFQKKKYNLGNFTNINDAIKARKEAEEKYFKPILDKYNKLEN